MQHLRVNFGDIWRFELGFFMFLKFFLKSSGNITLRPPEDDATCSVRISVQSQLYPSSYAIM